MEDMLDLHTFMYLRDQSGVYRLHAHTQHGGAVIDRKVFEGAIWWDLMAMVRAWHIERSLSFFNGCWPDEYVRYEPQLKQMELDWQEELG